MLYCRWTGICVGPRNPKPRQINDIIKIGNGHVGKAIEQHRQHDMGNGTPRYVGALTEMWAIAECLMGLSVTIYLIGLTIFIAIFVAVGANLNGHDGITFWDVIAADFRVFGHKARRYLNWRNPSRLLQRHVPSHPCV